MGLEEDGKHEVLINHISAHTDNGNEHLREDQRFSGLWKKSAKRTAADQAGDLLSPSDPGPSSKQRRIEDVSNVPLQLHTEAD